MFIKDAVSSSTEERKLLDDLTELETGRDQISDLDVSDKIHKYNTILQKKQDTQKQSERLELEAEREKTNVIRYEQTIAQLVAKVEEYTSLPTRKPSKTLKALSKIEKQSKQN
jgi:hypothetical protein